MNAREPQFNPADYGEDARLVFEEIKVPHDNPDLAPVVLAQRLKNLRTYLVGKTGVRYKVVADRRDVYLSPSGDRMMIRETILVPDPTDTTPMSKREEQAYAWILKTMNTKET